MGAQCLRSVPHCQAYNYIYLHLDRFSSFLLTSSSSAFMYSLIIWPRLSFRSLIFASVSNIGQVRKISSCTARLPALRHQLGKHLKLFVSVIRFSLVFHKLLCKASQIYSTQQHITNSCTHVEIE